MSAILRGIVGALGSLVLIGFGADWGDFGCFWLGMVVTWTARMISDLDD